jgi:DNA-binding transcriptional regulator GbsR (MarR family)
MIRKNYLTIQGWQVTDLKLSGSELIAYALIFGFCQAKNKAKLSLTYISEWLGNSKRATIDTLKRLQRKGLIKAEKKKGEATSYKVVESAIEKAFKKGSEETSPLTSEETSLPLVKKLHHPSEETSPLNLYKYPCSNLSKSKKEILESVKEQLREKIDPTDFKAKAKKYGL